MNFSAHPARAVGQGSRPIRVKISESDNHNKVFSFFCSCWLAIAQQKNIHCNTNGGGYIWVDPELLKQAAAERTLPPPLSYAGVLLRLLPLPVHLRLLSPPPPPLMMSQMTPSTTQLPSIIVPSHAPQRHSRRLANQAELTGGHSSHVLWCTCITTVHMYYGTHVLLHTCIMAHM